MYFGLIKTTKEWYQSDAAGRLFQVSAIATLAAWLCLIFLDTQPSVLHAIQSSVPGKAGLVLAGGATAFVSLALLSGMGWYFWHLDPSPIWARAAWVVAALIPLPFFNFAPPFVLVAYYLLVYRRRVLQVRRKSRSVASG